MGYCLKRHLNLRPHKPQIHHYQSHLLRPLVRR